MGEPRKPRLGTGSSYAGISRGDTPFDNLRASGEISSLVDSTLEK